MITYVTGNILDSDCDALVNTVNTVGVMGKGIAKQFKDRYPSNYYAYRKACAAGELCIGGLLITQDLDQRGPRTIVNFPTKKHWRNPSKYEYITSGLAALKLAIQEKAIASIAIPPLGCGHGGLQWIQVRPMIADALSDLEVHVVIYEPTVTIKHKLREEAYYGAESKLTSARAMLLQAQYAYERAGGELTSLFVATKLAYFLQRLGEPLRLNFRPHFYGPYDRNVGRVMESLNGTFIRGLEQNDARAFEELHLDYSRKPDVDRYTQKHLTAQQRDRLDRLSTLMRGYEAVGALEVLSTVDYIRSNYNTKNVDHVIQQADRWSERKRKLLRPNHVAKALSRLEQMESEDGFFFSPPPK